MSSKGLGRGLDALLRRTDMGAARQEKNDTPEKETGTEHSPTLLPLSHLHANPSQPRQTFDAESLAELAASIREQGIIQPLLVRPLAQHYVNDRKVATNADRVIGREAVVTEDIDNIQGKGRVSISGADWTARAEDDRPIPAGSTVRVLRIEGVKVIVAPAGAAGEPQPAP